MLILRSCIHPSEWESVIAGLQGVITEYCFTAWLTQSFFVYARRLTSEAEKRERERGVAENEAQLGVPLSYGLIYIVAPFLPPYLADEMFTL